MTEEVIVRGFNPDEYVDVALDTYVTENYPDKIGSRNYNDALRASSLGGRSAVDVFQSLELADSEFQTSVAPYTGYEGPIDPSVARFHSLPDGVRTTLEGFAVPADDDREYINVGSFAKAYGDTALLPAEPGTINAIDAGATPQTWAHEYNHLYEKDRGLLTKATDSALSNGGEGFDFDAYNAFTAFGRNNSHEVGARMLDIRSAQNMGDVRPAAQYIAMTQIKDLISQRDNAFDENDTDKARELSDQVSRLTETIINNPTEETVIAYVNDNLGEMNNQYDEIDSFRSNFFDKTFSDKSMYRQDGSKKSMQGFLGPIENVNGGTMTEYSIGVEIDGEEVQMPSMVPTLSEDEIEVLRNMSDGDDIPQSIKDKAIDHYYQRIDEGKDPFYQDGEEGFSLDEQTASLLTSAVDFGTDFVPVVSEAKGVYDTYNSLQEGDYVGAGIDATATLLGVVPGFGDVAGKALKTATSGLRKNPINAQKNRVEYDKTWSTFDDIDNVDEWQKTVKQYVKDDRTVDPVVRTPELEDSARKLIDNEITRAEHLANVQKYKPVNAWDDLPREPSDKSVVFSLKPNQRETGSFVLDDASAKTLGVARSAVSVGSKFNGRLDIPAYKDYDTWIVAGTSKGASGTHYAKAVHYQGKDGEPVKFLASKKAGEKIGVGGDKTGYATVSGWVKSLDTDSIRKSADDLLNDPDWIQVGFDPRRQGAFYVREGENVGAALKQAEEVIQIGPLILAKKADIDLDYKGFADGGLMVAGKSDKKASQEVAAKKAKLSVEDKRQEDAKRSVDPALSTQTARLDEETQSLMRVPEKKDTPQPVNKKLPRSGVDEKTDSKKIPLAHGGMLSSCGCGSEEGCPSCTGMAGVDPISGNEIPYGSSAENVRDDIPAALSTGEYVMPADVVRWHGLKHIMDMHAEAKMGLMSMEFMGQIKDIEEEESYEEYDYEDDAYEEEDVADEQPEEDVVHQVFEEMYPLDEEDSDGVGEYPTVSGQVSVLRI